jgi:ATP-dependent Clp protease ATP-binding subunit ClpA
MSKQQQNTEPKEEKSNVGPFATPYALELLFTVLATGHHVFGFPKGWIGGTFIPGWLLVIAIILLGLFFLGTVKYDANCLFGEKFDDAAIVFIAVMGGLAIAVSISGSRLWHLAYIATFIGGHVALFVAMKRAKEKTKAIVDKATAPSGLITRFNPKEAQSTLSREVMGQTDAITGVVETLGMQGTKRRQNLANPRPLASMLFVGPTGVGKTELAKALARLAWHLDDRYGFLSFDMSEFYDRHTASRLVGPPPGYTGSERGGQLTQAMIQNPWRIILFDEIEKADPSVFPMFLQILDEGRLTDASTGEIVDFSNTVIIMTSNLASESIRALVNNNNQEAEKQAAIKAKLARGARVGNRDVRLPPEFLGRLDAVVAFKDLDDQALASIIARTMYLAGVEGSAWDMLEEVRPLAVFGAREVIREVEKRCYRIKRGESTAPIQQAPGFLEGWDSQSAIHTVIQRVVGQDEALGIISKRLSISIQKRAKVSPSTKPLAVFLLVGPTGVGKTETAKAFADTIRMIEPETAFLSFDMSEFYDRHTAARLVGSPPGYVGAERGGQLTQAIIQNPKRVILFDEIEKADPSVFSVFLQIFDEGRLTDASTGEVADFTNTVIFLTSNLAAERIRQIGEVIGDRYEARKAVLDALKIGVRDANGRHVALPSELLGRVDDVVPFESLTDEHYIGIIATHLKKLGIPGDATALWQEIGALRDYGTREIIRAVEERVLG